MVRRNLRLFGMLIFKGDTLMASKKKAKKKAKKATKKKPSKTGHYSGHRKR